MDKFTHEELSSQPLQSNTKHFKKAVIFLTGYNGTFNVTDKNDKFYFAKSISGEAGFKQITPVNGAYEIESLNKEYKRIIIDEDHFTDVDYPFTIKPNFSTIGSIIDV